MRNKSTNVSRKLVRCGFLLMFGLVLPIEALCQESFAPTGRNIGVQPNQTPSQETPPKTNDNPQLKKIIDQMSAAGILHPTTLSEAEKAYLFYTTLSGMPKNVLRIDNQTGTGRRDSDTNLLSEHSSRVAGMGVLSWRRVRRRRS